MAPEPYLAIGNGMRLSEAYAELVRVRRLPAVRSTNAAIKQRFFDEQAGLVPAAKPARGGRRALAVLLLVLLSAVAAAAAWRATPVAVVEVPPPAPPAPWWSRALGANKLPRGV